LVTIKPSLDITKPEPKELNSRSEGSDRGILNGKLKKSSIDGTSGPVCSITPVVEILTTEGDTLSAKSENVSGPVNASVITILFKYKNRDNGNKKYFLIIQSQTTAL
jgi:hypothetical protein